MPKQLLVFGEKTFKITVPNDARMTFGPWSPPNGKGSFDREALKGTLRVYRGKNTLAVFSGVEGFRDVSLDYAEQVAKEEGAVLWKSDKDGYQREEKVRHAKEWVGDPAKALPAPAKAKKGKKDDDIAF